MCASRTATGCRSHGGRSSPVTATAASTATAPRRTSTTSSPGLAAGPTPGTTWSRRAVRATRARRTGCCRRSGSPSGALPRAEGRLVDRGHRGVHRPGLDALSLSSLAAAQGTCAADAHSLLSGRARCALVRSPDVALTFWRSFVVQPATAPSRDSSFGRMFGALLTNVEHVIQGKREQVHLALGLPPRGGPSADRGRARRGQDHPRQSDRPLDRRHL